ncbi:beta-glucuronidase-like [Chrysoperla carnea]|uniref:beta-glucuronidase-like n=1 Tax=Chrysoperla carnea TaxID=189513 RepID=UPI001D05E7C3|nr:beta-glucuronidase-like [Chrysoperla carnea]
MEVLFILNLIQLLFLTTVQSNLYPRDSETRDHRTLDGIWNFMLEPPSNVDTDYWFLRPLDSYSNATVMPVPSSYNDIATDKKIRDHVGPVWYDRTFFVPFAWDSSRLRVWLRFGSVNYAAKVWLNGEFALSHKIGHLPFESDVTNLLLFGETNRITVEVDNTLDYNSIPQGVTVNTSTDNGYVLKQSYTFDFFNYAGIHRPVILYTTPIQYIQDIRIRTTVDKNSAAIDTAVLIGGGTDSLVSCTISVFDHEGKKIRSFLTFKTDLYCEGRLLIENPNLWWPYLMNENPGYLYTLEVKLIFDDNGVLSNLDVYRLPFGIRSIRWTNTSLLINEKPVYFRGFGRHEDSDIRGKGLDLPLVTKDYNLIKWIGANAYRTSHYPYAEEIMDFADKNGIMIIDECPSVDTDHFDSPLLLQNHQQSLFELIQRDKNRPSVIAWSIANEPRTGSAGAGKHFQAVADFVRQLDNSRPITIAIATGSSQDQSGAYLDIISFNRYNGWYANAGQTDMIINQVVDEARAWHKKYQKPVLMSEYGADTMQGLHLSPGFIWSEEYQVELFSNHFQAFDKLRAEGFFIGEFIWNFADFKTGQSYTRVGGNKKGIFTRQRDPKSSAHLVRRRYLTLAAEIDNFTLYNDLYPYISSRSIDEL